MKGQLTCPACGSTGFDLCNYESMIVLAPDRAMFTMCCPHCATLVSSIQAIPAQLREEVRMSAIEVGAGMGRQR